MNTHSRGTASFILFTFLAIAVVSTNALADDLFVQSGGSIYKFDTAMGASSKSAFVANTGGSVDSLAVDASGNVFAGAYTSSGGTGFIEKYAPDGTGATYPFALYAFGLTLDANGNLFMDGESYPSRSAVLYQFTPATNETVFTSGSGLSVGGLAFDASGTLWMANGGYGTVIKFAANGSHTTFATLPSQSTYPRGLAFDGKGNLFVSDFGAGIVYEFTNNAGTLSNVPQTFANVAQPYGLAFDGSGNLYVVSQSDGKIYEFANNGGTVSATPTTFASGLTPTALAIGKTSATAGASWLHIMNSVNAVIVSWPTPATGSVVLQTNGTLTTSGWADYGGTVTISGTTNSATFSPVTGNYFFRLSPQ